MSEFERGTNLNPFSDEAMEMLADVRGTLVRHRKLVIIGAIAATIGICSVGSLIASAISDVPEIHWDPASKTLYVGFYSHCGPIPDIFPDGTTWIHDHGGVSIGIRNNGTIWYVPHAPGFTPCRPAGDPSYHPPLLWP